MFAVKVRYLIWHYTKGVEDLIRVSLNLIWFLYNFFSISILFRTLFMPWERLTERAGRGSSVEQWAEALVTNVIMRIVGAIVRLSTIIFGILTLLCAWIIAITLFIMWILLPFILLALVLGGIYLLIYNA